MRPAGPAFLALAVLLAGCRSPDPRTVVDVSGVETYWAIDAAQGEREFIAPVVRFQAVNKGSSPLRTLEAQATFRRQGETAIWSSAWQRVTGPKGGPLPSGATSLVVLKPEGEGRYFSTGPPEGMFAHPQFRDATVEVFLRIGASRWTRFLGADVQRRIGTRSLEPAS